ncbi:hypothetical protein OA958_02125 [Bacteroidota bacterium]|nr:hypothetical protein [Bacteroidota bacterium]|tara:strand:- start:1613 stop:2464 length:852 start_codon:yes stop_codon:yes gene_type:complete
MIIITRYCHISIKYTLYFFQKIFILFTILFFSNLSINNLTAQFNDTLSLKYKNSKILIISKNNETNEWGFDIEEIKNEEFNHSLRLGISYGNLQLNNFSPLNGINNFSAIPYNKVNSSNFKFNFYLKSFKLKKDLIKIFIGLGLEKNKLNLGYNSLNILGDSLVFFNLNMFNIKRNNLNHHFLNIPINLSWMPFKKKNENFKTQIEFTNHFLWYGKTNFRYHDNDQVFNHSVKNDFFFEKYYLSGCFKIIWKNIGAYFQTNLTNYSTLFPNIYNYSYGLTLCL